MQTDVFLCKSASCDLKQYSHNRKYALLCSGTSGVWCLLHVHVVSGGAGSSSGRNRRGQEHPQCAEARPPDAKVVGKHLSSNIEQLSLCQQDDYVCSKHHRVTIERRGAHIADSGWSLRLVYDMANIIKPLGGPRMLCSVYQPSQEGRIWA